MKSVALNRLKERKWGVMCHFLNSIQNNPEMPSNEGVGRTFWNEVVAQVDVKNIAKELHEMKAGYVLFTIMQGYPYLIAPNATYDRITGSKAGESCSKRDLVLDLYAELQKYEIDLYLYFTGDGPYKDPKAGPVMGFHKRMQEVPIPERFLKNWSAVLKEYAERYKDVAKGWWIDGCYDYFGYTEEKIKYYHDVLYAANPNFIVTYNDGWAIEEAVRRATPKYDPANDEPQPVDLQLRRYSRYEDYVSGEAFDFNIYPDNRFLDGSQWHILSPLGKSGSPGGGWGGVDVKYTKKYLSNYLKTVWEKGGVVTIDMGLMRSGKFYPEQKNFIVDLMGDVDKS